MADKYLDSAAGGTASGDDWANAYTAYSSVALSTAGDRLFIASGHSDSSDNIIQGVNGGTGAGVLHISVDKTGTPEPPDNTDILSGATLTTSSNDWTLQSTMYLEGIKLISTRHLSTNVILEYLVTKDCTTQVGQDDQWIMGGTSGRQDHYNLTVSSAGTSSDDAGGFSAAGNGGCVFNFYGGQADATGTAYKNNIIHAADVGHQWNFYGFDFSSYGLTGGTVGVSNASVLEGWFRYFNCKFPHTASSFGLGTSATGGFGRIEMIGCGLVDNVSQEQGLIHDQFGDMEVWGGGLTNRAVYRDASVAPPHQTNPLTWRVVPTSRSSAQRGFVLWPMMRYYSTTGSTLTVTVHYLLGDASSVAALDDTQLNMCVEYYDDTGVLYKVENTRSGPLNLGGETNHSTSGATWTTTDAETASTAYSFAHTTSGTVAQEGFVKATIEVYDIGTNDAIYFDTRLEIT